MLTACGRPIGARARALFVRGITRKGDFAPRGPPSQALPDCRAVLAHRPRPRLVRLLRRVELHRPAAGAPPRDRHGPRGLPGGGAGRLRALPGGRPRRGAAGRQHAAGACWRAWATAPGLIGFYKAAELGPLSIVAPIGATGAIVPVAYGPGHGRHAQGAPRWRAWCSPWPARRWPRAREPARDRPAEPRYPDPRASVIWALGSAVAFGVFLTALPEGLRRTAAPGRCSTRGSRCSRCSRSGRAAASAGLRATRDLPLHGRPRPAARGRHRALHGGRRPRPALARVGGRLAVPGRDRRARRGAPGRAPVARAGASACRPRWPAWS